MIISVTYKYYKQHKTVAPDLRKLLSWVFTRVLPADCGKWN